MADRTIANTDITTAYGASAVGSAWVTRQAPNTKAFMALDQDNLGNTLRTYDQPSGRIDMYGVASTGAACVVALNKSSAPANGDNLGHFAFRGKDSNNNLMSTWAYVLGNTKDITPANACGSLSLSVMRNVDTSAGNGQPNWGIVIDGSGASGSVTMPSGATTAFSGNITNTAASGPTTTYVNSTNSRNLVVGVADNFNGSVNSTGGGSLLLQSAGTSGISVGSTSVNIILPTKLQIEVTTTKTSNYTIVQSDGGSQFNNSTAAGTVVFTLPTAPTVGTRYGFTVITAQSLQVLAPASVTINVGGTTSAAAGNIASSQIGAYVELEYVTTNKWHAKMVTGTGGSTGAGGWTVT